MRRTCLLLAALLLVSAAALWSQQPPLIDRQLFFGDPEVSGAQISPDGKYITFLKPYLNVRNIWVKERSQPFDQALPITADTNRPVIRYFWSRDSRYILYAQDKGGDENYRIYAVDPHQAAKGVPPAKDLTPMASVRAMIIDVPLGTPDEIIIGLNDRRADLHDVYRLNIVTGERTLLWKNEQNVAGWITDLKGNLRLGVRVTETGGTEILNIKGDQLAPIYSVTSEESCGPVRFTPDGQKFYMVTNKGEKTDKIQLELFDLKTGKTNFVEKDPLNEVDLSNVLFSDVTDKMLATFYVGDRVRVYPKDKGFQKDWEALKEAIPDAELGIAGMTADEKVWVVTASSDVDPGSRYLFDTNTGKADLLYRSRPELNSADLSPMKPVSYKSRDGFTIHSYLTLPKGLSTKNLPLVMLIHGGPWGRDVWGYDPEAQFLANRGYAVMQPNFRGSAGYGKKFLNAGNKQWGTGGMQNDITDGVKYLIAQGTADPKRVAIYGGSYGGYATLAGLAFTPDLYAAGVSYVGPSNIITLLKSIPPYWAPVKKIFSVRVGDLDNPDDVKRLEAQSPLNSAKNITAPLLVAQGANDPRVKKAESDQIVVALRDMGHSVEYLVAPDEGHGFLGKENRLAFYAAMEHFLAEHVGGRYQESMAPDVKQRLDVLTVDIKTVELPKPPAEATASMGMPAFDGSKVLPGTVKYVSKFDMRGTEMSLATSRTVSEAVVDGKKVWRVIEVSSGPMGAANDTLDLDAATLLPVRRSVQQGPAVVNLTYSPTGVTGKMSRGGMSMPLDVKVTSPVIESGANAELAVGVLPLKAGYTSMLNIFDMMGGTEKGMTLTVLGKEQVAVAAGTFEAYKVSLANSDGQPDGATTLWVSEDSGRTVKSEVTLPSTMGGGLVTTEMVK